MKDELASYLGRLKFDPKLWNSFQAHYLTNFRLVLLLIISIFVIGLFNYFDIPRRLNPEINIAIVTVSTALPGATPEDIETLITIPLEDKIKTVENIDVLTSSSRDNVSVIVIQFLSTVDPDDAQTDVQQVVDSVSDLPEDATTPTVQAIDFESQPVWTFALLSEDVPTLMKVSENLQEELEDASHIDRVQTSGNFKQEIVVLFDTAKIAEYGISPIQLSQALSQAASSYPAGLLNSDNSTLSLAIDSSITTLDDIRDIRLSVKDQVVSLGDIATVQEKSALNQQRTYYADKNEKAQPAVQFFVYKTKSSDIDESALQAEETTTEFLKPYKETVQVVSISNTGELITKQFDDLIREFATTILLIFILLLVFLGLRQAIIASFTVPLTFLSAIAVAQIFGMSLNFLTLFSFLIALGLLIDDTIVVVTAMTRYYSSGKFTPIEAGILVWRDFIVPIWSTTITTIWSFVPLLLATGIIGEFIKPIPIIITATMISSTSIAVFITIPLMVVFLKPSFPHRVKVLLLIIATISIIAIFFIALPKNLFLIPITLFAIALVGLLIVYRMLFINRIKTYFASNERLQNWTNRSQKIMNEGVIDTAGLSKRYMEVIKGVLDSRSNRRNVIIFLIIFALASYMLVPLGFVKNEFFPSSDEDTLYVSGKLPSGTNLQKTNTEALIVQNKLRNAENVEYSITETGYDLGGDFERSANSNSFLVTLHVGDADKRDKTSTQIAESLREQFKNHDSSEIVVREISGGPPAGADIQISLLGEDLHQLDQYAGQIITFLEKQPGVTNPEKTVEPGTSKLVFIPDENKLAQEGISRTDLALWLRTYATGFTLDSIRFEEEQDVIFRLNDAILQPEDLSQLSIQTPEASIPLLSLGEFRLGNNPTLITREGGKRTLSVVAGVEEGYNLTEINAKLEQYANSLNLPSGYEWKTGGVNEENQKSINSILQAMILSFILILGTMVIEFRSYRQAAIVMFSIPLAVSGVFYLFGLTGTPLSFPALIGILALFGIVVTNAIVVVEKINDNRRDGMKLKEAIVDASGSRLEPVLLTSLSTIFGLLPITLADPLWRGLGGAIISGLFFSGMIKLFFVPVVYYMWYRSEE